MKKSESMIGLGLIEHELRNIRGRQRRRIKKQDIMALRADQHIKGIAEHLRELKKELKALDKVESIESMMKIQARRINREVGTNVGLTGIYGKP